MRTTLVTLVALPLSILSTFVVFQLLGQSVNTMTLGGIAIGVGELVDDAVVGVENIHRRLRENRGVARPLSAMHVVFEATCEVRGPILVSTAIVLLVFLPLFFLPGIAGRLFTPLAWAYIVSIFASMVVSLTVTPALAWFVLARGGAPRAPERGNGSDGPVLRACKRGALWAYGVSLPRPGVVLGVCAVLVILAAAVALRLGKEFLPPFNEGTAVVSVTAAPGISLGESDRLGRTAEQILLGVPEVKRVARRTGRAENDEHVLGVNASEIEVDFFKPGETGGAPAAQAGVGDRTRPAHVRSLPEVFADVRAKLAELPGVTISIGQPIGHRIEHLETGVQAQIVVKVFGPELGRLRSLAERTRDKMAGVSGVTDLEIEQQALVPQVRVKIDAERAALFGFTVSELVDTLQTAVGGKVVSRVLDGMRTYDLVVMFDDPWRADGQGGQGGGWGGGGGADEDGAAWPHWARSGSFPPRARWRLVSDVANIRRDLAANQISRENGLRHLGLMQRGGPGPWAHGRCN